MLELYSNKMINLSPQFTYELVKKLDGIPGGGSTAWWSARVGKIYGQCPESLYPFNPSRKEEDFAKTIIPEEAYSTAREFNKRFYQYYQRLYTLEECFEGLKMSPLVFSFDCFEGIHTTKNGYIPVPRVGEKNTGNHTVSIYGYSKKKGVFKFQNSWGANWGNKGFGVLPFEYVKEGLVSEIWSMPMFQVQQMETARRFDITNKKGEGFTVQMQTLQSPRKIGSPLYFFDIFNSQDLQVGCASASIIEIGTLEIEEMFIIPEYQNAGLGNSFLKLFEKIASHNNITKVIGWIGAQDLMDAREEKVLNFYKKNKYSVIDDYSKFRDCFYRIEKTIE